MITRKTLDQIEKRWVPSAIAKTHYPECHLEHWSCAIQILVDELRARLDDDPAGAKLKLHDEPE